MAKLGRPSAFTPELLEEILTDISNGLTERASFRKPGRPEWSCWTRWKRANPDFYTQLAHAERDWCTVHEDVVHTVANDISKDITPYEEKTVSDRNGITIKTGATSDNTAVQRHKLIIDTTKNLMKWKMPERYGDKIQNEHSGSISVVPVIELATKETK